MLPLVEAHVINTACSDPGAVLMPHLILPMLQRQIEGKAAAAKVRLYSHCRFELSCFFAPSLWFVAVLLSCGCWDWALDIALQVTLPQHAGTPFPKLTCIQSMLFLLLCLLTLISGPSYGNTATGASNDGCSVGTLEILQSKYYIFAHLLTYCCAAGWSLGCKFITTWRSPFS